MPEKEEIQEIKFTKEHSKQNLEYLAKQLALNHFHSSTVDLFGLDSDEKIRMKSKELINNGNILKNGPKGILSLEGKNLNNEVDHEREGTDVDVTRNILVVGAGCSFNAFQNIPLATGTVELLKKNITVADFVVESKRGKGKKRIKISLKYLLDFSKDYNKAKTLNDYFKNKHLKCRSSNAFLRDQFKYNDSPETYNVIPEIAKKIESGIQKWRLTNLNQRNNKTRSSQSEEKQIDFESFLNIIGQVLSVKTVREAMYDLYNQSEGTTLFYSIIAHLFKNRFIDVIVNFNFDELLDKAIDDEIGTSGYLKVLSDGDCSPINAISRGGRLRQPLYIKPHGTASHKSTLRFTKDQYQELPNDMRSFLSNLISGQEEKELINNPRSVNLITAGFEMSSIEFNEILIKNLPEGSAIFDIFWHHNSGKIDEKKEINEKATEKINHLKNLFSEVPKKRKPYLYPIAHMLYQQGEFYLYNEDNVTTKSREFHRHDCSLGNTAHLLFLNIHEFFEDQFKPRNIDKHLVVNALFGNRIFWNLVVENSDYNTICDYDTTNTVSFYPDEYFNSADYFRDRVLIEALVNLTVNDGKIDLHILMQGIAGYYYSKYAEASRVKRQEVIPILELLKGFNFTPGNNAQSLGIRYLQIEEKTKYGQSYAVFEYLYNRFFNRKDEYELPFSKKFARYLDLIGSKQTPETSYIARLIYKCFKNIRVGDNSKIYANFDDLGNHIFKDYNHLDVVNTNLANNLHFFNALSNDRSHKIDRICIVADQGYQIANFLPQLIEIAKIRNGKLKIYLIIQDHFSTKQSYYYYRKTALNRLSDAYKKDKNLLLNLDLEYSNFLNILVLPIVDHNRHMVLFLRENKGNADSDFMNQEECVEHSIYYYKKGLSQKINPIHLTDKVNQKYLLQMFSVYSKKAADFIGNTPDNNDQEESLITREENIRGKRAKRPKPRVLEKEEVLKNWIFDLTKSNN